MPTARVFLMIGLFIELSTSISLAFRPFRTEDAGITPIGFFSVELGNEFSKTDEGKDNVTTFALTYGLLDWIETEIDFAVQTLRPDSGKNEFGFGDTVILSKFKIVGEKGVLYDSDLFPDMVIRPSILIPTGDEDKGTGSGQIELGILLVLEKAFWKVAARANLGYFASNDPTLDQNFEDRFFYGVQADVPLFTERLSFGTELTGEFGENVGAPLFSLTGFVFEITENVVLDAGVELGLKDAASAVTAIVGITFGFNPFEEFLTNR
ncbi:MAG TPA: transporter [Thermodesulfobacteriota bacterium]|nr:transporter [Thermodesulfobacteriota bacterium]